MPTVTEHDLLVQLPEPMSEIMLFGVISRGLKKLIEDEVIPSDSTSFFVRTTHDCDRGHIASSLDFAAPNDSRESFAVTSVDFGSTCVDPPHFHKFDFHTQVRIIGTGDVAKYLAYWMESLATA